MADASVNIQDDAEAAVSYAFLITAVYASSQGLEARSWKQERPAGRFDMARGGVYGRL